MGVTQGGIRFTEDPLGAGQKLDRPDDFQSLMDEAACAGHVEAQS